MAGRLQDRVAIVTGGGDGIGRGIVRRFAAEGAKVLVAELNEETGAKVAKECESEFGADVRFLRTDASDKGDNFAMIDFAKDTWGTVDVLVNNAWGNGGGLGRVEHKTDDEMWRGLTLGFMGPFWAMQHVLPIMKAQGRGNVVNICSLNGVNAHMFSVEYNASKEALRTMTRTAAVEWGRHNIRCNVICPGAATEASKKMEAERPDMFAQMLNANPMRRFGDPEEDIGGAAVLLSSDYASYITGNTLMVGGGTHVNGVPWRMDLPDDIEDM